MNIAIYALNLPDGSGELNNFADTTFQNWIANINHIYANNTMPTAVVPGVAFIPDTKIQFNLVGIFHPNVQIFDDQANPGASYALPTLLPNAISIILSPGPTGNGVFWGYGLGQIGGNIASITLDSADIFINNHSMSRRNELGAHELGHVLSLYHTSGSMAGICNITLNEPAVINDIYHPDYMFGPSSVYDSVFCIFNSTRYFCNMGPIPNNVMGYSKEVYFSPRQMAKMRRNIITKKQIFLQTPTEAPYCNTYYSDSATVISQDETYSGIHVLSGDIIIDEYKTLIVTGCLFMPAGSRIIVSPTAKLIVDGGTITSTCINGKWLGIEVHGTASQPQAAGSANNLPEQEPYQGICVLQNGATINNASTGVYVGTRLIYGQTGRLANPGGGTLWAENSVISQCDTGVYFVPYNPQFKFNKSYLRYNQISDNETGVLLNGQSLIKIEHNSFLGHNNQVSVIVPPNSTISINAFSEGLRGTGIYASGSATWIKYNDFSNLTNSIKGYNDYSFYKSTFIVKNHFEDNIYGVTGNFSFAKIDSNYFYLPMGISDTTTLPAGSSPYPYGIYLDNSNTFTLQLDSFVTHVISTGGSSGSGSNYVIPALSNYGLIVKNGGNVGGEVKNNCYFGGLYVGTQTEEENPNLQIRCNKYDNNTYAWRVNPQSTSGTLAAQGTSCNTVPSSEYRANNTFEGCSGNKDKFESYLVNPFTYYYWNNTGDVAATQKLIPCTTSVNNNVITNSCGNTPSSDPTQCPVVTAYLMQLKLIREQAMDYILAWQDDQAVQYLLNNVQYDEVKMMLVAYYYGKEDMKTMQQYLNQLPNNKEETKQYRTLYTLLKVLKAQNGTINDMKPGQVKQLMDIAKTPTRAGSEARGILEVIKYKKNLIKPEQPTSITVAARKAGGIIEEREPELGQNIPNPSNSLTLIRLYVPEKFNTAKLLLINSLGEPVYEKTLEKGEQEINFNTVDLPTGIYFYTLMLDNKAIAVKRMAVIK